MRYSSRKNKTVWSELLFVLLIISGVVLSFSTLGSIVYGLYQWCAVGIEFKAAVWAGLKVWLVVGGSSLVGTIVFGISSVLSLD